MSLDDPPTTRKRSIKKPKARQQKRRTGTQVLALPEYTPHVPIIAQDLHSLTIESRERTNREIKRCTSLREKHDALSSGIASWKKGTYEIVRQGLLDLVRSVISSRHEPFSLRLFQFAERSVSLALTEGLGPARVNEKREHHGRYLDEVKARLSNLGRAPNAETGDPSLKTDDPNLQWLRELSSEWVKLACDDPADGVWLFFKWQAPKWACESTDDSSTERATDEQTDSVLNEAAAQLRDALENARFDAYKLLSGHQVTVKPPRNFEQVHRRAIERLWRSNPARPPKT